MATRDGPDPASSPDVPFDSGDALSSSSLDAGSRNDGLTPRHAAACRWRTTRYHDQECSRYFDCPSHVVERALSDHEHDEEEGTGLGDAEDRPDPGAVSPLNEDEAQSEDYRSAGSSSPGLPDAPPHGASTDMGRRGERPPDTRGQQAQGPDSSDGPIPLIDSSPMLSSSRTESEREAANGSHSGSDGSREPTLPSPGAIPRSNRAVAGLQSTSPAASFPALPAASVPRQSALVSAGTDRGGPSEFVLPRWQPDAEVTYCPICHTQFSIFVRKHHCR